MKTILARSLVVTALFAVTSVHAEATYVGDRLRDLDRATQTYERAGDQDGESPEERAFIAQCRSVVPFRSFCGCLARKLPPGLTFQQYLTVLSRTKEQNNYDSLAPPVQQTYDAVPVIRDECAAATSGD